jgi:CheY-like chemotaxis protein
VALLRRDHQGLRVLLVEDNAISAEVATDLLQDAGLAVDRACDGVEAVSKAAAAAYDLVLMDVQMPRLDGLQATRAIRALPGWQHRPIIALTANVLAGERRQCLEAGMNDFLGKPLKPESLYQLLWRWVGAQPEGSAARAAQATAAADADAALEGLAALADMDREQVLSFRGKAARYLDLLGALVARHGGDMAQLAAHLEAGDLAAARQLAHSLRGNAAMLGAARLVHAAEQLEAFLLQDDAAPPLALVEPEIGDIREALAALAQTLGLPLAAEPADAAE